MQDRDCDAPGGMGGTAQVIAAGWLVLFHALIFVGASPAPPPGEAFAALAMAGWLYGLVFQREPLRCLLRRHRLLLGAALALVAGIVLAEGWMASAGLRRTAGPLPAQVGMLLCLAPLALVLRQRRLLQASVALFALLCAWHVATLPVEALTGVRWGWHDMPLIPREWGAFHYQAAGLAWQVYFFAGLYLPLFFLALGPAAQERLWPGFAIPARIQLLLGLIWLAATTALQSRSAFAGVLAATVLGALAAGFLRRHRAAILIAGVAAGGALYWLLFSVEKSAPGLRWAYLKLYAQRSLEWPWVLSGRSYSVVPDGGMAVPGLEFLPHSHNDLLQVLFFWGLPVLLLYLLTWFALLRLAWREFWQQGRPWPVLAFVTVLPSLMTDLGLHHYEKAAFLVLLAGLCMALAGRRDALTP